MGAGVNIGALLAGLADTIDLAGLPPGPHKILIESVNANHEVFPGQSKTVTVTIPAPAK